MTERSTRRVLLCLSLLTGIWCTSVSAADQVSPYSLRSEPILADTAWPGFAEAVQIEGSIESALDAPTYGLLVPSVDLAVAPSPSASTDLRCLPAVPRSLVMVALGFLCVSAVHDRRMWLAILASTVSLGYAWPQSVLPSYGHSRSSRDIRRPGIGSRLGWLPGGSVLLAVPSSGKAWPCGNGRTHRVLSAAMLHLTSMAGGIPPCLVFVVDSCSLRASELTFSQLPRGPPARAQENVFAAFREGSVRARPFPG